MYPEVVLRLCAVVIICLLESVLCRKLIKLIFLHPPFSKKDAPGISTNIIHCYNGDDPWVPAPHWAAPSRVQHAAAPSMLGNVQRTALSALLPSSSCEFKKEEPKCQWHPCCTPYQPFSLSLFMIRTSCFSPWATFCSFKHLKQISHMKCNFLVRHICGERFFYWCIGAIKSVL